MQRPHDSHGCVSQVPIWTFLLTVLASGMDVDPKIYVDRIYGLKKIRRNPEGE